MLAERRMESEMIPRSLVLRFMLLLAVGMLGASCGAVTPDTGLSSSLLPTRTALPIPTLTPIPTATAIPTQERIQLVLLHTNDNWGETEPCG